MNNDVNLPSKKKLETFHVYKQSQMGKQNTSDGQIDTQFFFRQLKDKHYIKDSDIAGYGVQR